MPMQQIIDRAEESLTVRRVFGEPYEADEMTIIPAARVRGGAGGGDGEDPDTDRRGSGGGFAVDARPIGAFVIHDGTARWRPAVDVTRIVVGAEVVVVIALLTVRSILKARLRARTVLLLKGRIDPDAG
jgi:uncharacterized spore protein YtfJ